MKLYLLTKAKKIIVEEVPASQRFWIYNEGAYHLESSSIKLSYQIRKGKINPNAEIFFTEGCPDPLGSPGASSGIAVLDSSIYENFLDSIGHASYSEGLMKKLGKLRDAVTNPKSISIICFALAGLYIAYLYLHGAIKI